MPSEAFSEYRKNLTDVRRLVRAHDDKNADNPGKRGLGHFTRGGLLLLCAAWERYVESVLEEGGEFLTTHLVHLRNLPPNAQKETRNHANNPKTKWNAAELGSDKWRSVYLEALKKKTVGHNNASGLNTPKYENLLPLFRDFLDVPDIALAWTAGSAPIDEFVSQRGEVAHRGGQSAYVRIGRLIKAETVVQKYVVETDNFLSDHLRLLVSPNHRPWKRTRLMGLQRRMIL